MDPAARDARREQLIAYLDREFGSRGLRLKPGAAAGLFDERMAQVAEALGISVDAAIEGVQEEDLRRLAANTLRGVKEVHSHEAELPPVPVPLEQVGAFTAACTTASRMSAVNGNLELAAELAECATGLAIALRNAAQESPRLTMVRVEAAKLLSALRYVRGALAFLAAGDWTVHPPAPNRDLDAGVQAQLEHDCRVVERLIREST